jgi:hypothetical protein
MAYVDGYMLALEDLLKDISGLRAEAEANRPVELAKCHAAYNQGVARIHKQVRLIAGDSLKQARTTLEMLEARPQHVCSEPYYCPTAGEMESCLHGGFDICCNRPELHRPSPDLESRDAVREEVPPAG